MSVMELVFSYQHERYFVHEESWECFRRGGRIHHAYVETFSGVA